MRIAIFHHLRSGGAKRALYELAKALAARGHHLDAYTLSSADETFLPLAGVVERVHVEPFEPPVPLATRRLPFAIQYVNLGRRLQVLSRLEEAEARVAALIDAGRYDVAFVHPDFMVQSPYVLRHLKTPSLYYCQEPLRVYYEPRPAPIAPVGWKGRVRAAWYAPVEPLFERRHKADDAANARAATRVLANSAFSQAAIARAYGISAFVSPLGVDTALFRPLGTPRENAVIAVGRFQEKKDQALAIEALARLAPGDRPTLILVGESSGTPVYRDHLLALAAERGVHVELLEHVSDEALVAAYNRARLAIVTPVLEPFGFVPLEAGACGIPTVGVREGGVAETVVDGETGLLVARDAAAVADAVAALLSDDERRERMGASALARVRERWSWDASAEAIEQHARAIAHPR